MILNLGMMRWVKHLHQTIQLQVQSKTLMMHIDEASAYLIRNTYPTYSKVPPVIQALKKLPLGAFISFPAEILEQVQTL